MSDAEIPMALEPEAPLLERPSNYYVFKVKHDVGHDETSGVKGPGELKYFYGNPLMQNQITDIKIVLDPTRAEPISDQDLVAIAQEVERFRSFIARILRLSEKELEIHLGTRTRNEQLLLRATWDRDDGLADG